MPSESVILTSWLPKSVASFGEKVKVSTLLKVIKLIGIEFTMVVAWPSASKILGSKYNLVSPTYRVVDGRGVVENTGAEFVKVTLIVLFCEP